MEGLKKVNFLLFVKVWYRPKFRVESNNIVVYFSRWKRFSAYHSFVIRLSSFYFHLRLIKANGERLLEYLCFFYSVMKNSEPP